MAQTVFDELNRKIEETKASHTDALTSGGARTLPEYREMVGVIRGLAYAQQLIYDLAKREMDDDDD